MRSRSAASSWCSPAKRCPLDGVIVEGSASLNTSALTGESLPRDVEEGDEIISGCINMTGVSEGPHDEGLRRVHGVEDPRPCGERQLAQVEIRGRLSPALPRSIRPPCASARWRWPFWSRWCRMLAWARMPTGTDWIYRALTFLVVSCPCALVISIPLSFFAGIGGASKEGILVKGSNYLEALSEIKGRGL